MSEIEKILNLCEETPSSELKKNKARPMMEKNKDHYINLWNTYQMKDDKYNKIKKLDSATLNRKIDSHEITLLESILLVDFDIKGSVISNIVQFGSEKYVTKLLEDKSIFDDELILYYALKNKDIEVFKLILQNFKKNVSKENYHKFFMKEDDNVNLDKYNIIMYLMKDFNLTQSVKDRVERLNIFLEELNLLGLSSKKTSDGGRKKVKRTRKRRPSKNKSSC
jgi:hypothetical protein